MELLREFVRERVVRILGLAADETPDRHDRLMDLGLDSLMAVQLRNLLGVGLNLEKPLPSTLMFDHPSIEALAIFLGERLVAVDIAVRSAPMSIAGRPPSSMPPSSLR